MADLADDMLRGADEIAEFLFGDRGLRRRVYHLADTSRLPHFKLGSMLCARRSVILAWIEAQERVSTTTQEEGDGLRGREREADGRDGRRREGDGGEGL